MEIPDFNLKNGAEMAAGVGAVNLGLGPAVQMNPLVEYLGQSTAELAFLVAGAGGALVLADRFELADPFED